MLRKPSLWLCAAAIILASALLTYSQIRAFAWDEGFHLLAAQLIKGGKRPYLDFFFPQTPLNAYWNALWMTLFGDTWRTAHAVAALCTSLAALLTGGYLLERFPVPAWRFPGAIAALFIVGLNVAVFQYGTIGQAYGLCLLTLVGAFRMSVIAVERSRYFYAAAAGLLAAAAAASSLLTAPAIPVMLVWILVYHRAGGRLAKLLAFCAGAVVPFLPVLWPYAQRPREVFFAVLQYNYRYREVGWDGTATEHNLEVLTAWLNSSQAMLLGLLALGGIWFTAKQSEFTRPQRAEFYLCAWLSVAMSAYISTAHPTFQRYFLLVVPFLAVLSVAGLYRLCSSHPGFASLGISALFAMCLARSLYDGRDAFLWTDVEAVARKVNQVTPPGAALWADEHVYFVSRSTPPTGMEHENSHKPLNLPDDFTRALHILPRPDLEKRIREGAYYTAQTCEDSKRIDALNLPALYLHLEEIGDCTVYWEPAPKKVLTK